MPEYYDIADHGEDTRIQICGKTAMENPGKIIGVCTDAIEGKAERYIAKIQEWFPQVTVLKTFLGPVKNFVTIQISRLSGERYPIIGNCHEPEGGCRLWFCKTKHQSYGTVAIEFAKIAYVTYSSRYPGQSFERLKERGGFGHWEMTEFTGSEEWKKHFIPRRQK